jgi:hypothetical protein
MSANLLGITPTVRPPASLHARETAPIIETWPPPQTKLHPLFEMACPKA